MVRAECLEILAQEKEVMPDKTEDTIISTTDFDKFDDIDLTPRGSQFNFGDADDFDISPKNTEVLPIQRKSNPVKSFFFEGFGILADDAVTDSEAEFTAEDISRRNEGDSTAAVGVLRNPALGAEKRLQMAKTLLDRENSPRTPGDVFVNNKISELSDPERKQISKEINIALRESDNRETIIQITDPSASNWDDFVNKIRDLPSPEELLGKARALDRELTKGLEKVADVGIKVTTLGGFSTVKEWAQWLNPIPYENSIDVDWGQAMELVEQGQNPFAEGTQFQKAMESKYGKDWKSRWAAFAVKEIGVDAMILFGAAVYPPLAQQLFAGKGAAFSAKFKAVMNRAAAVGIGGGSVQTGLDALSGDPTNIGREVALRFGGELLGEAVWKGITTGWKVGKGATRAITDVSKSYAKSTGRAIYDTAVTNALRNGTTYKGPLASTIVRASTRELTNDYFRLSDIIADGLASPEDIGKLGSIREQISKITGIKAERLDVELPLLNKILNEEFKDVTPGAVQEFARIRGQKEDVTADIARLENEKSALITANQKFKTKVQSEAPEGIIIRAKDIEGFGTKLAEFDEQITSKQAELRELDGVIRATEGKMITTGNELVDRMLVGEAVGFRLMGSAINKQKANDDMFLTYMNLGEFSHRPMGLQAPLVSGVLNPLAYVSKMKKAARIADPEATFKLVNVAKDLFDQLNLQGKYERVFTKMLTDAGRGLGSKKQQQVWSALQSGSDNEVVYTPEMLVAKFQLTPKQQDMYYKIRKALDEAHMILDSTLVHEFKEIQPSTGLPKGMKWRGLPVTVKRGSDKTMATITPMRDSGKSVEPRQVPRSELEPMDSVLPAHTGYLPRAYANAKYHITKINKSTGEVSRIAAHARQSTARDELNKLRLAADKGVMYIMDSWDDITQTGAVAIGNRQISLADIQNPKLLDTIKKSLQEEIGDVSANNIKLILDRLDVTHMRKPFVGKRADKPIPGADLKEAPEAVAEYLAAVARAKGISSWRRFAREQFQVEYGDVLDKSQPLGSNSMWKQGLDTALLTRQRQARREWAWIQRMTTNRTYMERQVENMVDGWVGVLAAKNSTGAKRLSDILDRVPVGARLNGALRGTAAIPKLLLFSLPQLLVQGSQTVVTAGANPIHAAGGVRDGLVALAEWGLDTATRWQGRSAPTKAASMYKLLERSGYISDVTTNDIMDLSRGSHNTYAHTAMAAAQAPFRAGEGTNRAIAFFTARRKLLKDLEEGKLKGVNGTPFKGQIDDDEFLRLVTDRAKITALNMGRAGQLELMSGYGSVLFQFKQVLPKIVNVFETTGLSPREKLGSAAALVGTFGFTAVPLLPDLVTAADWANWQIHDKAPSKREFFTKMAKEHTQYAIDYITKADPEFIMQLGATPEFLTRLAEKGSINALTNGEVDLVHRIALGQFINDMFEVQEPLDIIPAISVLSDMIDAAKETGMLELASDTVTLPLTIWNYLDLLGTHGLDRSGEVPDSYTNFLISHFTEEGGTMQNIARNILADKGFPEFSEDEDVTSSQSLHRSINKFGKVVSIVGSWTRAMEAIHGDVLLDGFNAGDPTTATFRTSSGRTTAVQPTRGRLWQLAFGITPGKIVEQYDAEKIERKWTEALQEYEREFIKRFNDASGGRERENLLFELNEEMMSITPTLHELNLQGQNWHTRIRNKAITSFVRNRGVIVPRSQR